MGKQLSQQVKARIKDLADTYGAKQSIGRRDFLKTNVGMASAFLAMNNVFGNVFNVSEADATDAAMANECAEAVHQQFIFDLQTYVVRNDCSDLVDCLNETVMSPDPNDIDFTMDMLRITSSIKQGLKNSGTDAAMLCGRTFYDSDSDLITQAINTINADADHTVVLVNEVVTPGQTDWMAKVDSVLANRPPASWELHPIGNPNTLAPAPPYRLDDERLMYPFYEKVAGAGIVNMCVHKGLIPLDYERERMDRVREYLTPRDLVKAAADWPQLNFIIYGGCFSVFDNPGDVLGQFDSTGRIDWCTDLAEIPIRNGTSNIYAETGTTFTSTVIVNPRLTAAILGTWIKGLGASNVVWGSGLGLGDLTTSWMIEAFRRMEIPEDMQERYGFAPLGGYDSAVKQQIFGLNSARLYEAQLQHRCH